MNITSAVTQPNRNLQAAKPVAAQVQSSATEAAPAESFQRSSEALPTLYARDSSAAKIGGKVAKGVAGAAIGGALVAWATSGGGTLGGIAGAASLAMPAFAAGLLGGGLLTEQTGNRDASDIVGGAIWGGLGGGALGLTAGALLGSSGSSAAAIGLAVAGAASGGLFLANFDFG